MAEGEAPRWVKYDDELKKAREKIDKELSSAERQIRNSDENISNIDRYIAYLSGDTAGAQDSETITAVAFINDMADFIQANNEATGQSLSLADFFTGPQTVEITILDTRVEGDFTFRAFAETIAANTPEFGYVPSIRSTLDVVEEYEQLATADTGQYIQQREDAITEINRLTPIGENLRSDDPAKQVTGMRSVDPVIIESLAKDAEDGRTAFTDEIDAQLSAVEAPIPTVSSFSETDREYRPAATDAADTTPSRHPTTGAMGVPAADPTTHPLTGARVSAGSIARDKEADIDRALELALQGRLEQGAITQDEYDFALDLFNRGQELAARQDDPLAIRDPWVGAGEVVPSRAADRAVTPMAADRAVTPGAAHPMTGASGTAALAAAQSRLDRLREERAAAEAKTGYVLPEDGLINGRPAGEDKDELDARIAEAEAEAERLEDELSTPGPSGPPRLSAADIQAANEDEVHALLSTQFGGFAFFLQRNKTELMVGLNADGMVVAADDPTAVSAKNVLDVIVEQGITDPNRVTGILQNTEWWKNTDAVMRQFDANYGEMSEPEKLEFLEPVLDTLRDEARFLGFEMSTDRARELAVKIAREGEAGDSEYIRGLMVAEGEFNAAETELSDFGAARDQIEALSRSYYVPIGAEEAAQWAEDVYVGTKSATQVEQYFKEMAINKFPTLKNAIEGGLTADQYFAPYKYEIEKMLDRPNVDLYEEFGDVIEYMPDTGGDTPRPMTLGEVRKYVRGLDEWQTSTSGQDSARSLAFAIGKTFGEVA